ncbi:MULTISPECIES: Crp/Fnr family transcriptional regulator [Sphingobacterium]|uniref:Crp/Fnr family transcriptional regulator n=1 Tax=Sphingobacterium populi TaxID=1812824 RepID=A0ABW5UD23_9SPHI|nr:Crp/Fnr family transcriptional regulator [Sphingobacterium sp. CFCC 11742]
MKEIILSQVYQHPLISTEDLRRIIDAHEPRSFSKGEHLYKRGKVLNEYLVLESGLIRSFTHNYQGDEITTDFFGQYEVVIEVLSLFQRTALQEDLQALTDGCGWTISYDVFQELFHAIPGLSEWGRLWMTNKLFQFKQKSIDIITQSAKERYLDIVTNKPQIIRHAPLKQIASYLGITDTSLSRIRKDIS